MWSMPDILPGPARVKVMDSLQATHDELQAGGAGPGFPETPEGVAQGRLSIRRACPDFNTSDPANPTCNRCGCQMSVKMYRAEQVCPVGKW